MKRVKLLSVRTQAQKTQSAATSLPLLLLLSLLSFSFSWHSFAFIRTRVRLHFAFIQTGVQLHLGFPSSLLSARQAAALTSYLLRLRLSWASCRLAITSARIWLSQLLAIAKPGWLSLADSPDSLVYYLVMAGS